jgi:hypothetical protein
MPRLPHRPPLGLAFLLAFLLLLLLLPASPSAHAASRNPKSLIPTVRWDEQTPGCTFSRSEDGKLHYGLWSGDVGVMLAIDSQELEKVHRRHEPFFSAFVTVRFRGSTALDLTPENMSLEFVRHFRIIQNALDPDDFVQKVQDDADEVDHDAARYAQKHPDKKVENEAKEAYVRAFQKDVAELLEFVSKNSLRPARLTQANPEVSGWMLFRVDSKWIGGWKKKEEFVLRVPLEGKIFEFPFTLPPQPGEVMLRRRE